MGPSYYKFWPISNLANNARHTPELGDTFFQKELDRNTMDGNMGVEMEPAMKTINAKYSKPDVSRINHCLKWVEAAITSDERQYWLGQVISEASRMRVSA